MAPKTSNIKRYLYDAGARVLTVAFALLLAIPAIGSFFADTGARSRWENRPLAEFPSLFESDNGSGFFAGLDLYLNDHFGFALELNRLHRKFLFLVFQDSPSQDISLGEDGYVFLTSFQSEPFSVLENLCVRDMDANKARVSAESWTELLGYFANSHANVALLIVPSKPTIYPEKLTLAVPRRYREACAGYKPEASAAGAIATSAQGRGYVAIYPYKEFFRQKYDGNFYPKENFHFTGRSAHWLGRETLKRLEITVNADYEESVQGIAVTHDLMNLLGFTRQLESTTYPYTAFPQVTNLGAPAYVRTYFERVQQFGTIETSTALSQRTALLVGNSFTPFIAPHLAPGYRSLTYIMINGLQQDERVRFFTELIPRIAADDLIFVFNDNVAATAAQMWMSDLRPAIVLP